MEMNAEKAKNNIKIGERSAQPYNCDLLPAMHRTKLASKI